MKAMAYSRIFMLISGQQAMAATRLLASFTLAVERSGSKYHTTVNIGLGRHKPRHRADNR